MGNDGEAKFFWVLGVITKEIAITAPIICLLLEALAFGKNRFKKYFQWWLAGGLLSIAFASISLVALLSHWPHMFTTELSDNLQTITQQKYAITQLTVIPRYFQLLVLPINQSFDHQITLQSNITEPIVLLSLGVILSLITLIIISLHYRLYTIAFGVSWIYVSLLTTTSFIVIQDLINEHRLYIAMFGFALVISAAIARLPQKYLSIALITLATCLSIITFNRNRVWNTPEQLWGNASDRYPQNPRPYFELGVTYQLKNNFEQAETNYNQAIELNPNYVKAITNLGVLQIQQGKYSQAKDTLLQALELKPGDQNVLRNLNALEAKLSEQEDSNQ